jgi:hypothetical protein
MADLNLIITEKITLGGVDKTLLYTQTISGINYIDNRTLNITGSSTTTLFSFSDTPGAGTFVTSSFKYGRITNKSTTSPVRLLISSSENSMDFLISTGSSFLLNTSKVSGSDSSTSNFIFKDIISVKAQASGSSADIEYFIATN